MHDRRIDGETHTFGNLSVLYMSAMTWWDHKTQSIWSQPWGAAIGGELEGARLTLLPFELVRWDTWLSRHPDTRVLVDENGINYNPAFGTDRCVIGVAIRNQAKGFYFASVANARVVNDTVGDRPVLIYRDSRSGFGLAYSREAEGRTLTFATDPRDGQLLVDEETGTRWDPTTGAAVDGDLAGTSLERVHGMFVFWFAWTDFYPETELYQKPR